MAVVAVILVVLLVWSPTTPKAGRAGFYLGLATVVAWLVAPGGEMFVSLGRGTLKRAVMVPIVIAMMVAPSIVLVEAGIAGYLGFVSLMRYVSAVVTIIGIAWMLLGFAVPTVLRRQSRK